MRRMQRSGFFGVVAALVTTATLVVGITAADASWFTPRPSTVDQQAIGDTTGGYQVNASSTLVTRAAQTFTAGKTGVLDQVTLKLEETDAPGEPAPAPLQVLITTVGPDGNPARLLGGGVVFERLPLNDAGTPWNVHLLFPVLVARGAHYAIVLNTAPYGAPGGFWIASATATPYPAGAMKVSSGTPGNPGAWQAPTVAPGIDIKSFYFQTWVR